MTHCLASCDSLISSSFAYAEPAAATTAVLSAVPIRNFRIPILPVTIPSGCFDADKPKRARSRHQPLPGEAFPAACHGMRSARTVFLSDPHSLRRNADTPEPADALEAGNYYHTMLAVLTAQQEMTRRLAANAP